MNRRQFTSSIAAATLGPVAPFASAKTWPEKPVKLLLSLPAGSGADAMARMIGEQLALRWGQPVVVENRPGGQNVIGAQAAARAAPDGYSFYFATAAALVTNVYLFKNMPYDPRKDFAPVGMIGKVPFAICVNPASRLTSLKDLVAFAKAEPGRLSIANEGPKTFGGMMTRLMASELGIEVNPVPYVSIGEGVTETIGGQVEVLVSDVPSISQMVKAGRLRPLSVTTAKQIVGWDNVPPVAELIPGFDFAGWLALVAPIATPAAVIQRVNRDLDAVLANKTMAARLLAIGPMTEGAGTVEQTAAFLRGEHARWAKLTRDLNIHPE